MQGQDDGSDELGFESEGRKKKIKVINKGPYGVEIQVVDADDERTIESSTSYPRSLVRKLGDMLQDIAREEYLGEVQDEKTRAKRQADAQARAASRSVKGIQDDNSGAT